MRIGWNLHRLFLRLSLTTPPNFIQIASRKPDLLTFEVRTIFRDVNLYVAPSVKLLYLKEMGATSKHSPVYNWYTRSPTSPSGFTQMADQSDTLASSQLFICLELLLLLANILTLVEITLQSTTYTPGAQLVLVASLKWLTKVTHLSHVNSSFV